MLTSSQYIQHVHHCVTVHCSPLFWQLDYRPICVM